MDRFKEILASEPFLKKLTAIMAIIMIAAFAIATLILLIIGIPNFETNKSVGWICLGLALFFIFDITLCLALYFHNKSDNVVGGRGHLAFCIFASICGCFPVTIPFFIREKRIAKKLDLD